MGCADSISQERHLCLQDQELFPPLSEGQHEINIRLSSSAGGLGRNHLRINMKREVCGGVDVVCDPIRNR